MSNENVEVARRAIAAWNREDLSGFIDEWHPDGEWHPAFARGVAGAESVYRGHEGIRRAWQGFRKAWQEFRFEIEGVRPADERVVVLARIYARAAKSGVELDSAVGAVMSFRDGKIASSRDWLDQAQALEAAGLSESG